MSHFRQTPTFLPVDALQRHPGNVRDDLGDLTDLAVSIREHGILQPLTVTEHGTGGYLILAGHRRFGAGLLVGLEKFPAIIRHGVDDQAEQVVVMLVENTQRKDLDPVEKAQAFQALVNHGLTQSEIARRVGCSPQVVNYHLAFMSLDDASLELLREGRVTFADAHAAAVEARQEQRVKTGPARRGRKAGTKQPTWFSFRHRLFDDVVRRCQHTAPKIGKAGCGECWEAAIVDEARAQADAS